MIPVSLIHAVSGTAAMEQLAKEIGARLDGTETDIPIVPLYICEVIKNLIEPVSLPFRCTSKHPIGAIGATMVWTFIEHRDDRDALLWQTAQFHDMIDHIDCDDGWPQDKWLCELYSCCVAMRCTLEDPVHTRWLAEIGNSVADLVLDIREWNVATMQRRKRWVCARLLDARHAVKVCAKRDLATVS